ncbi:MAG TPA: hypothetical protein V6C78_17825 [Crinalium sp.]
MTTTLTRFTWSFEWEVETFNRLLAQYAPHIPLKKTGDSRQPETVDEWDHFYRYRIAGAAHDLFIVQVCARAIADLFSDHPDVQLFLSRQIGDDGAHSIHTRQRVFELSGHDPVAEIQQQVQWHQEYLGDLPTQSWLSFLAWELHYELHIVAILLLTSRLTQISEPESAQFASDRILPDEAVHRRDVVTWWQREYEQASPGQRSTLATELLRLDNEIQRRRNSYLKDFWHRAQRALGFEVPEFGVIYDAWRKELLAVLLDIPVEQLPTLVSIND